MILNGISNCVVMLRHAVYSAACRQQDLNIGTDASSPPRDRRLAIAEMAYDAVKITVEEMIPVQDVFRNIVLQRPYRKGVGCSAIHIHCLSSEPAMPSE